MPEKIVHVSLRMNPDLHRLLSEWAGRERRSMHAQLTVILERAAAEESKRQADAAK